LIHQEKDEANPMYEKILVPLDGSKRAEAILPHVEELAIRFDSLVIFLEVINRIDIFSTTQAYMPGWDFMMEQQNSVIERRKNYLSDLEEKFRKKNIQSKVVVEIADIVSTIIEVAEREGVDLIAMASHGRTGLSHVFYGSIAAGVLHRIDRPILLIRSN
jgi:nucleotide-binding universal stress UspA family protein